MRRALAIAFAVFAVLVVGTVANGGVQALITGANIKDGSIGSNDIRPGAIRSHDIQNGTIAQRNLSIGLLTQLRGAQGAQGVKGDVGDTGDTGDTGAAGPAGPKGDAGTAGATGSAGLAGPAGPAGPEGEIGISHLETDGPYPGSGLPPLHDDQGGQSTAKWSGDEPGDGTLLQQSWVMCAPPKVALGGGFGQNDDQTDKLVIVTSTPVQIAGGKTYLEDWSVYKPIDAEGSFVPNGWLVQGYNQSLRDLIVRPWVICAEVDQ